jgi:hypothetical protein
MTDLSIELVECREANLFLRESLAHFRDIAVKHIAASFISGDRGSISRAKLMATALDNANMNVDRDVENSLTAEGYSYDQVTVPVGLNRSELTWTDYGRKVWDLSVVWVDKGGNSWAWTGCMSSDQPVMRRVGDGSKNDAILDAIQIFDGPLTPGGPRPAGLWL